MLEVPTVTWLYVCIEASEPAPAGLRIHRECARAAHEQRKASACDRKVLHEVIELIAVGEVGVREQRSNDDEHCDRKRDESRLEAGQQKDAKSELERRYDGGCDRRRRNAEFGEIPRGPPDAFELVV